MSKLEELMRTTPETLANMQIKALKEHIIEILDKVRECILNEDFDTIENLTFYSGQGDGWGEARDNDVINFAYKEEDKMDILEIVEELRELRTKIKKIKNIENKKL